MKPSELNLLALKPEGIYSTVQVAKILQTEARTVLRWIRQGKIDADKFRGKYIVHGRAVFAFLDITPPVTPTRYLNDSEYPDIPAVYSEIAPGRLYTLAHLEYAFTGLLSYHSLYRAVLSRDLPASRVGNKYLVLGKDIQEWFERKSRFWR